MYNELIGQQKKVEPAFKASIGSNISPRLTMIGEFFVFSYTATEMARRDLLRVDGAKEVSVEWRCFDNEYIPKGNGTVLPSHQDGLCNSMR